MDDETISEDDLALLRGGDEPAWERLLHLYRRRLLTFIDRLLPPDVRTSIDPQDVLNDTCFEAYRRFPEFVSGDADAVFRWLATIARHRLVDLVRAQRRLKRGGGRTRVGADGVPAGGDDPVVTLLHELAIYERTPSRSAMRHELAAALERSISRLSGPLRDAVRLRHVSGLPFKEVAERMSRTERAVQQLCTRALRELRTELESASYFL